MVSRTSFAGVVLGMSLAGLHVQCQPEAYETVEAESSFQISVLWGQLCDTYVDELGYTIAASVSFVPGHTVVQVLVTKTYTSGDSHLYGYDFQVDAFDYDDQSFYLYLSNDEENLDFEVVADYLPYDPDDPGHLDTVGEMTMYYGPFKETFPVGPEHCVDVVWDVFFVD